VSTTPTREELQQRVRDEALEGIVIRPSSNLDHRTQRRLEKLLQALGNELENRRQRGVSPRVVLRLAAMLNPIRRLLRGREPHIKLRRPPMSDIPIAALLNIIYARTNAILAEKNDDGRITWQEAVEQLGKLQIDVAEAFGEDVTTDGD